MRFMVVVQPSAQTNAKLESGWLPTAELMEPMVRFNEELAKAGVMLAADGLHPSSKGARIEFRDGKATVTDGPFAETKELIGGFWIVQAKSKEEVIERFRHAPMEDGDTLEIRRFFEVEDFSDISPELRERMEAG